MISNIKLFYIFDLNHYYEKNLLTPTTMEKKKIILLKYGQMLKNDLKQKHPAVYLRLKKERALIKFCHNKEMRAIDTIEEFIDLGYLSNDAINIAIEDLLSISE